MSLKIHKKVISGDLTSSSTEAEVSSSPPLLLRLLSSLLSSSLNELYTRVCYCPQKHVQIKGYTHLFVSRVFYTANRQRLHSINVQSKQSVHGLIQV